VVVAPFAAFGLAQYGLGRRYGRPIFWAGIFSILEAALLIGVILTPITFPPNWPPQMQLRLPTVFYLFVYELYLDPHYVSTWRVAWNDSRASSTSSSW
jgi:hypothetical protein